MLSVIPSVSEQKQALSQAIGDFHDPRTTCAASRIHSNGEGLVLIPKISHPGKLWDIDDPYGTGYCQIVQQLLNLVRQSRKFRNHLEGQTGIEYLRLHKHARRLLEQLEHESDGSILTLPAKPEPYLRGIPSAQRPMGDQPFRTTATWFSSYRIADTHGTQIACQQ